MQPAVLSAIIAAAVSLVVTAVSNILTARRDDVTRVYERRRTALTEAHDAARKLREAVRAYGRVSRRDKGEPTAEFVEAEARFDDATSLLDVLITRVDSSAVLEGIATWREAAQIAPISQVGEALTDSDERTRWDAMNDVMGRALMSKDGLPSDTAHPVAVAKTRWWRRKRSRRMDGSGRRGCLDVGVSRSDAPQR